MSNEILTAILTTVGVIGVPAIAGWWQYIITNRKLRIENELKDNRKVAINQSVEAMRSYVEVNSLLFKLQTLGFARVLILAFGNGGKIPKVGGDYYATAIDTSTFSKEGEQRILERYERVKVDADYIEFCSRLTINNDYRHHYKVPTREQKKDKELTLLQGWYRAERISESYILHLATEAQTGENEKFKMFILSLAFYEYQDYNIDEINWAEVMIYVNKIRDIYKSFYVN